MAANSVGNIHVNLLVNTGSTRSFTSAANLIGRDSDRMRRALGGTNTSVTALRASMSQGMRSRLFSDMIRQASQTNNEVAKLRATMMGLAAITGTSLTGAFAGTFLLQTADQANRLNNQLRTVTDSEEDLAAIRERLYAISQLSRSDMAATVTLYARLSRAAQEFGASQADIVRVTETIQKAFAIGGASQAEASGAAIQLSQGIASDRFSGEEYRSVSENAPVLLQQMARHLGVTIGKLREMAHAGELTGKVVTEAILGASTAIDADFNKTITTVGQSLSKVGNAFLMYIGESDSALGVTQRMSSALTALAENFEEIAAVAAPLAGMGLAWLGGSMAGKAAGNQFAQFTRGAREARQATLEGAAAATYAAKTEELRARAVRQATAADLASTQAKVAAGQADAAALRQTLALTQEQRAKAVARAELNRGIVEATGRTGTYTTALKAQHDATRTVILTQRALRQVEGELIANKTLLVTQTAAAATAATVHSSALAKVTVSARAAAVSMAAMRVAAVAAQRVGAGIMGIMGGWAGIAFTAAIVGLMHFGSKAAEAEERSRKLTDELHDLGLISDATAGHVEGVTASIEDLAADELRSKIRMVGEEIERLRKQQNPLEQLFSYDKQALGNMMQELTGMSRLSRGATPEQAKAAPIARELLSLITQFDAGAIDAAGAMQRLDTIGQLPGANAGIDGIISRLRVSFDLLGGNIQHVDMLQDRLDALNTAGTSADWVKQIIDQQAALDAVQGVATTLKEIAAEQVTVLGYTEEEARLRKVMADLRKEAIERGAEEANIQEAVLRFAAQQVIAAEDLAAKRKEAAEAQEDFNKKIGELSTEIAEATSSFEDMQAAATIERLLKDFATGNMKAETLKQRLEEVNSVNLSDPMDKLIAKIIAAIGPLAQLLGIFNSFGGASPLGGDLAGPARPGGALGRSRRELAAKQEIGQGVLDSAVADAGRSERDAWIKDKTEDLKKQAEALGGVATNAEATAASLWEMDQAQKDAEKSGKSAADAAEKYAEGMAELRRELAAAPLDPFVKEVLSAAEGMGIATEELDAFVAAVSSGGLAAAPEKFRAIASAMQEIKAIGVMRDLEDEALSMVQSPWDRRVFETLRDSGIEVDSVYGELIAQQIKLNEAMKLGGELSKDVFGGIAKDLMNGVSWTDALNNAVGRLRDRLMDMAIDLAGQAFTGMLGSVLGGMMGGGGFSSSITGSGGGYFPGLTGPRLPSFDGGGHTGSGPRAGGLDGKGGFLSLLHPNETVTDHTKGRTAAMMSAMPSAGSMEIRNRLELEIKGGSHEVQGRSSRSDGGINVEQIILGPVKKAFAEGGMDTIMEGLYGMKRRGG